MKLAVATLLLAALAVSAKLAVQHLAPERVASASVSLTADEVGVQTVQSIRISGLHATSFADLQTRAGSPLDRAALDADRLAIVRSLAAEGYLDAGVEEPRIRAVAGGLAIELPVVTGARYVVRDVRVEGKQARRLADVPTLLAGQDAIAARIDGNVSLLRTFLADRGIRAGVGVHLEVDRAMQVVDVIFRAD